MTLSTESTINQFSSVGVIGVGTMGHFMVDKLIDSGYEVFAYDISTAAQDYAREKGANISESPAQMAEHTNFIVMSLPGAPQIEQVVFGIDGLAKTLKAGSIVVDTSTIDPATTISVSGRLAQLNVEYLDCPILGRPSKIGYWLLPTGGKQQTLERATPILSTFASNIVHVGDNGAGNAVKLLNQLMFTVINAISSEVMAIADHCGISKEIFYQTVANSSAATVSGLFKEVGKVILSGDFDDPTFTVDLLVKDTMLALKMAKESGAPSVMAGTAQLYNEIAVAIGYGNEDSSALYKTYKRHYND